MQNNATTYFFELLQMQTGRREGLSGTPLKEEWKAMFRMAREQALVGVFTDAVCRLPEDMRPPRKPLARLCSEVMIIEDNNRRLFGKCCDLTESLAADGYSSCILKGQGMAMLYPKPLLRHSGDIDVWLKPTAANSESSLEDSIYIYARTKGTISDAVYHHVGVSLAIDRDDEGRMTTTASDKKADEVEMHFRPSFMFSPRHNRRLQKWFEEQWPLQQKHRVQVKAEFFAPDRESEACTFCCPTPSFNVIFCLTHIYRHLFDEGIGLRQLLDYYYVLTSSPPAAPNNEGATQHMTNAAECEPHAEIIALLKRFGLYRFAQAVMYVLHEVFGLSTSEMLVPMNAKTGSFLLDEILRAGNFGRYDDRVNIQTDETPFHKLVRRQRYSLRLLRYFPSEVLWQPYFKLWHRHWRLRHGWIKSWSQN